MSNKDKNPSPPRPPGDEEKRPVDDTKTELGFDLSAETPVPASTPPTPTPAPQDNEPVPTDTETVERDPETMAGPVRDPDPAASKSASQSNEEAAGPVNFTETSFPDDGETQLEMDAGTETGGIIRIELPTSPAEPAEEPEPFADDDAETLTRPEDQPADETPGVLRYEGAAETGTNDLTATDFFGALQPEPDDDAEDAEVDETATSAPGAGTATDVFHGSVIETATAVPGLAGSLDETATVTPADPDETATVTPPYDPDQTTTVTPPGDPDETVEIEPPNAAQTADVGGSVAPVSDQTVEMGHADLPLFPKTLHEPHDDSEEEEDELDGAIEAPVSRRSRRREPEPSATEQVRGVVASLGAWLNSKVDFRDLWQRASKAHAEKAERKRRARAENKIDRSGRWWRRTITEIAILYAIIIPIEMVVNGGRIGAFGVHPHPYWLIVLPLAMARGVVAGLLSAAVASFLYFIGGIQALGSEELATIFTYRNMMEPILFFAVGYFAGEVHDELELRRRKLERKLEDINERVQRLRQERDVLADANKELEKRIVDDSVQFGNLIVAARRIEQAGRGEVFELALELVEEHCGAAASVMMLLEDGSLDLFCHRGWADEETAARLAAARNSAFVKRAIAEGELVNGFLPEETPPESGPLVVSPLFDAGGVVRALLCLDDVPATRLNESTITVFCGIGEWVSAALARLARGGDAPAPKPRTLEPAPESDMYVGTVSALGERLRLELERCSRYGVPTSFLAIQAAEWTDISTEGQMILDRFVLTHFTSGLRPSDAIYRFGYPGCYLLVLAGTTIEGAEMVRTRLLRRVEFSPVKNIGAIEIFATGPDIEAPDLLSLAERVAGRFRDFTNLPLDSRCPIDVPDTSRPGRLDEFLHRLRMETSLAVRNGFDLHVVSVSADGEDGAGNALLARHVHEAGERTLRPTDGVYSIGPRHCAVILPCTASNEAATVAHRLVTAVRKRDPNAPYGNLETQVLGLGASHPDAGSFLQALAKRQSS